MPPRMRSAKFPSLPRQSARPQSISQPTQASRQFSQTPCQQVTLRRRKFYEWLNGPGRQLKEPLPESTNYLGAYDRYGNLARAPPGWERGAAVPKEEKKAADAELKKVEIDPTATPEGEGSADALEASVKKAEAEAKELAKDDQLPPESLEDLRPFPLNKHFRSQPVLSEELREAIYRRVKNDGATVSLASVEYGVSNERVGAVVRLKQMEKEWIAQGKTLAVPYSKAVLNMLPTTPHVDVTDRTQRPIPHEPINDLIVHPATRQQLWVPVSESRHFTREDAGKAFDNDLLPADARIPHPELVQAERDLVSGLMSSERKKLAEERFAKEQEQKRAEEEAKQAELRNQKVVPKRRWDFVFKDISVEQAGRNGRDTRGVGWRYGLPHEDRKKGQVKIPTKVDA